MIRFKYSELSAWLKEQIQCGNYKEGDRLPSENELAEQFGASRDTVRKAIAALEKENLVYKVKGSGTYVQSTTPAYVRNAPSNSKHIGILMNDIDSYIFPSIIKGINTVLSKQGYTSSIQFTNNFISQERKVLEDFLNGDYAGLIIEPTKAALPSLNHDLYQKIAYNKPALLIHAKLPTVSIPALTMGDEKGAFKLTEYLLAQGHTDIAIFCKLDEQTGSHRYLGFAKAYQQKNIPIPDRNIFWFSSEDLADVFNEPMKPNILQALSRCSAFICHDDRLALCLKKYFAVHPEHGEKMICGFDDSDIAKEYGITSIAHPKKKFGEYAALRLLEKINDPTLDVSFDFDPKLIIRNQK
ncbi:GntR family transcriptional regulator [Anaerotignum sp.]